MTDDLETSELPSLAAADRIIEEYDNRFYFEVDGKRSVITTDPNFEFPEIGTKIEGTDLKIGDRVDIKGQQLDGEQFELTDTANVTATLVVFWSSSCSACLAEIPLEKAYFVKYKDRGLRIVSINCDARKSIAKQTKERFGLPWPTVFDGDDGPIYSKYSPASMPTLLLLDDKRKILHATNVTSGGLRAQGFSQQKGIVYQHRLTMSLAKIFPPADSASKRPTLYVLPDSIPCSVIDEDGNPVANAKVVLNLRTRGGGTPRIYEAVTDAGGACRFDSKAREQFSDDDGYFTIMEVSATGYVPCDLPAGGVREVSEIAAGKSMSARLLKSKSITGTVRSESGARLAAAYVHASGVATEYANENFNTWSGRGIIDENGRLNLEVPSEMECEMIVYADGHAPMSLAISDSDAGAITLRPSAQ